MFYVIYKSRIYTEKYRWNKKLFNWLNESKWSKKHEKVYRALKYIAHLLIATSTVSGCVSIFDFASLVGIPIGVTSST